MTMGGSTLRSEADLVEIVALEMFTQSSPLPPESARLSWQAASDATRDAQRLQARAVIALVLGNDGAVSA